MTAAPLDVAKLRTIADQLDVLGSDDEALALIRTLDQAELAWLVAEFERRTEAAR
jgi:hypothetical protein